MSQTCNRCNKIVDRACQSDTEATDCQHLRRADSKHLAAISARGLISQAMDAGRPVMALGSLVGYLQEFGTPDQIRLANEIDKVVEAFVKGDRR